MWRILILQILTTNKWADVNNHLLTNMLHFCFRPLETAEENVQRLTGREIQLPYPELCSTDKTQHTSCPSCGVFVCLCNKWDIIVYVVSVIGSSNRIVCWVYSLLVNGNSGRELPVIHFPSLLSPHPKSVLETFIDQTAGALDNMV